MYTNPAAKPMGNVWKPYGYPIENPGITYRKPMGNLWEPCGEPMPNL